MHCIMNGIEVKKTPKLFLKWPTDTSNAIVVDNPDGETLMIVPL